MILAIFDLQVTAILPTKFPVYWPFGSGAEAKNRFSRWPRWPSWISERKDNGYFVIQVTLMLPTKFRVRWPFCSEEVKNILQDGCHGGQLGFPIRTILAFFLSTSHPDASYQVSSQLAFRFRRTSQKKIFKMALILDFQSEQF